MNGLPDRHHNEVPAAPNGAEVLVATLEQHGVDVCFANPGTSEMHFVAALDRSESMRSILCLAETVVTGAADGYARMSNKPGITLLHTGPGLGNGIANLHNAKKALSPVVNIVGEHATYHIEYDAPLTADIEGLAKPVSQWVGTCKQAEQVQSMTCEALQQATRHPGRVATLILPADAAWSATNEKTPDDPPALHRDTNGPIANSGKEQSVAQRQPGSPPSQEQVQHVAEILKTGESAVLILTSNALQEAGLEAASRLQQACGVDFLAQTSNGRLPRGAGRVFVRQVPYRVEDALAMLKDYKHVIRVCAKSPVAFFAYPEKPSSLVAVDANIVTLASESEDGVAALQALVATMNASDVEPVKESRRIPALPTGNAVTGKTLGTVLCHCLPKDAIVVDEAITNSAHLPAATRGAEPHDWLQICGGAIGDGMPLSTGAAVACPDRRVVTLQADGSGMYSLQALWTQARENLNVTTVLLANRSYAILKYEFRNVGAHRQSAQRLSQSDSNQGAIDGGQTARDLMDLDRPVLDWVSLARGMGVEAVQVRTNDQLLLALQQSFASSGPRLIEVLM